jgi:hypothetical protein
VGLELSRTSEKICTSDIAISRPLTSSVTNNAVDVALDTSGARAVEIGVARRFAASKEPTTALLPVIMMSGRSPEVPLILPGAASLVEPEKVRIVVNVVGSPARTSDREGQRRPVVELVVTETLPLGTETSRCRLSISVPLA